MKTHRFAIQSQRRLVWCLAVMLVASGCSGGADDGPELHRVSGRVTLDDEPLANARVIFTPKGGGRAVLGTTSSSGYYNLDYSTSRRGTLAGSYVVSIHTGRDAEEDPSTGDESPAVREILPAIYNTQSTLTATVPGGDYDFNLNSEDATSRSSDANVVH